MALGLPAAGDEARPPEHTEMLRNGRLGDAEMASQLTDGVRAAAQPFDETPARRVGEGLDGL